MMVSNKKTVSRLTGLPIAKKKTGVRKKKTVARKVNPAPRIGAAKPKRKSQITGKKPSMRLVARRMKNTRKGYYPNPLGYTVSVKLPSEKSFTQIASFNSDVWAKDFAKRIAAKNPSWAVKVEKK